VDQVLAHLADSSPPWPLLYFLPALLLVWWHHRQDIRQQIKENEAGLYCPHGKLKYKPCRGCAEDFVKEVREGNPPPVGAPAAASPAPPAPPILAMNTIALAPPGGELHPFQVDLPIYGDGDLVELEVNTTATWRGPCEIGFMTTDGRVYAQWLQAAGSVCGYRHPVQRHYGTRVKSILFPDQTGISRVRVMLNGCWVIDAPPSMLRFLTR